MVMKDLKSIKDRQDKMSKIQDDMLAKVIDYKFVETDFVKEEEKSIFLPMVTLRRSICVK